MRRCACCRTIEADNKKLKACGKCGLTFYCSKACQSADWIYHKNHCAGSKCVLAMVDFMTSKIYESATRGALNPVVMQCHEKKCIALITAYTYKDSILLTEKDVDSDVQNFVQLHLDKTLLKQNKIPFVIQVYFDRANVHAHVTCGVIESA